MFEPNAGGEEDGPWTELTDEFLALTDKLRTTYRRVADEGGPSEEEIRQALGTLAGAWHQIAGSVGDAVADPEVRSHLKRVGGSLLGAIAAGLSELGSVTDTDGSDAEEE